MNLKFFVPYHNNLRDLFDELAARHNCTFFVQPHAELADSPGYRQITFRRKRLLGRVVLTYAPGDVWRNIASGDTVVVRSLFQPVNLLIYLFCRLKRAALVVYQQEIAARTRVRQRLQRFLLRAVMPPGPRAFTVIRESVPELQAYFPAVRYIPLPVRRGRFTRRTGSTGPALRVLTVGKLDEERKNHRLLIDALETVRERCPKTTIELTIAGSLTDTNRYYQDLEHKAAHSPIKVELKQNVPYAQMEQIYALHDLFVLPAAREPIGYSILEAMASGLPVICSDQCGAKCYVDGNGSVCPVNKDSIVAGLLDFFRNGEVDWEKIDALGRRSLEIVESNHGPVDAAANFDDLLSS